MLRAFLAVRITPEIIREIETETARLRASLAGVRWIEPDNIHLTLKFLGDIEDARVDPIAQALSECLKLFPRFSINVKGLGVFPAARRPRILWVGIYQPRVAELAGAVETALAALGFAPEQRGFQPHLTIGRFRLESAPKNLAGEMGRWKDRSFGSCDVEEVTLFQSLLKPDGALHTPLRTIPLAHRRPLV